MSAAVKWIPTSPEVYFVIYARHRAELTVHGTITRLGEDGSERHFMTEWGLKGSVHPLISVETRGDTTTYSIAAVVEEHE